MPPCDACAVQGSGWTPDSAERRAVEARLSALVAANHALRGMQDRGAALPCSVSVGMRFRALRGALVCVWHQLPNSWMCATPRDVCAP